jgi:hypothetical protein
VRTWAKEKKSGGHQNGRVSRKARMERRNLAAAIDEDRTKTKTREEKSRAAKPIWAAKRILRAATGPRPVRQLVPRDPAGGPIPNLRNQHSKQTSTSTATTISPTARLAQTDCRGKTNGCANRSQTGTTNLATHLLRDF